MGLLILKAIKWIFIILLLLVLVILGLIFLLLISAISYQAKGSYIEKIPDVQGRVSYLFGLVKCGFSYQEQFLLKVKILGIPVYGFPKKEKRTKKEKSVSKDAPIDLKEAEIKKDEEIVYADRDEKKSGLDSIVEDTTDTISISKKTVEKNPNNGLTVEKKTLDEKTVEDTVTKDTARKKKIKTKKEKKTTEQKGFSLETLQSWKAFFTNPKIKRALADCKEKIFRALKAILPKKWSVLAKFGFADPSITGKIMAGLGILYPVIGNHIVAIPFFEEEILEIEGELKGKIRPIYFLWQILLLILNKDVRYLIKAAKKQLG
ncbi:MAG: hypothetical protein MJ134_02725 [Lachnospiraceae bacterium]|nr:hypothetical protein [Lachnospiraceae bacterium]